jgi:hypothetical protein
VDPVATGVPAAYVARKVLTHPERHAPPAQQGESDEGQRESLRTEQPDDVDLVEHAPEAAQRAQHRRNAHERTGQARVVGGGHEPQLGRKPVVRRSRLGLEPPDEHGLVEARRHAGEETAKARGA